MRDGIVKLVYALAGSGKLIVHESNKYCIICEGLESGEYQIIFFCDVLPCFLVDRFQCF